MVHGIFLMTRNSDFIIKNLHLAYFVGVCGTMSLVDQWEIPASVRHCRRADFLYDWQISVIMQVARASFANDLHTMQRI